uniref:Uncharacterized protein n=1 Tax=Pristionchus pacificus TaxID=54126 RepID=A0A2A6D317_PRIPA|eukprot:PDM84844.1 hypothetical protein PRIPAC_33867 [Pristionchus pacificus]
MERRIYPLKELELYEVPLEIDELQEKEVPSTDNLIAPDDMNTEERTRRVGGDSAIRMKRKNEE